MTVPGSTEEQKNIVQILGDAREQVAAMYREKPLYAPITLSFHSIAPLLVLTQAPDVITFECKICTENTTWERHDGNAAPQQKTITRNFRKVVLNSWRSTAEDTYVCHRCKRSRVTFWVNYAPTNVAKVQWAGAEHEGSTEVIVQKVGQWPRWEPKVSNRLRKALGANLNLFQNGVANLGVGFGIGAAAYFRRVVENEVSAILDLIQAEAQANNDATTLANLSDARKQFSAEERLKLAANTLPASLRPSGRNPLEVLYGLLSKPLHSLDENASLEVAQQFLASLKHLFETWKQWIDSNAKFAEDLAKGQRLLDGMRATQKVDDQ